MWGVDAQGSTITVSSRAIMSTGERSTRGSTLARFEYVYALPLSQVEAFADGISERLELDPHYDIEEEQRSKRYVTTLYFDTDTHEIAESCANGGEGTKLRAREYYAPAGDSGVYREADLWLEIKRREGSRTTKQRCNIPARELAKMLDGDGLRPEAVAAQRSRWGEAGERVILEILALFERASGRLRPDCIAHYRRRAWEDPNTGTRVTLDTELACYSPPAHLFEDFGASLIEAISRSRPLLELGYAIVEVKLHGPMPTWLEQLLPAEATERPAFSKFLLASRTVSG